jgi:hypothetical protein
MPPMTPKQLKLFDEASDHSYECKCEICKEWWKKVPPEDDDPDDEYMGWPMSEL